MEVELLQFRHSPYNERRDGRSTSRGIDHRRIDLVPGLTCHASASALRPNCDAVLRVDGTVIAGSAAILRELDRIVPAPPLRASEAEVAALEDDSTTTSGHAFGARPCTAARGSRLLLPGLRRRSGDWPTAPCIAPCFHLPRPGATRQWDHRAGHGRDNERARCRRRSHWSSSALGRPAIWWATVSARRTLLRPRFWPRRSTA